MSTEQSYVGKGDSANSPTQAAQNGPQPLPSADNRPTRLDTSVVNLPLCVWETGDGKLSEISLVYWALEDSKHVYHKSLLSSEEGSEEFEQADYCHSKLQEIQNNLFNSIALLASKLSVSINGVSNSHE